MSYLGDFRLGDTFDFKFTTVQTTGAPFTLAGSPVISAYPANSTTQLTAGITLTVDFDGVTGLNQVRVVASGGNGYLTATDYEMVITTGTVNSVSVVGYVVGTFSIEHRSALMPATAGRTAVVDASGLIDANAVKLGPSGSGTAQTARDIGTSVLLSAGSGTGQLDFTSGVVKANLAQILGTALTETAGLLAGGFKKFFNIASPAATMDHGILVDTVTTATTATNVTTVNGLAANVITATSIAADAITDAKVAADVTIASVTGAVGSVTGAVGSVTGAVGSVTGAVGSVTGNVGGNVVGSVASVTGAVGSVTGAVGSLTTNNDKTGYTLSNTGIDNVLDRAAGVETSYTLRQALRLILAACAGKLSGAATATVKVRDVNDSVDRITATVDSDGNRSAVTTNVT